MWATAAVILILLGVVLWPAINRMHHWRRTLNRVDRTEWDRVLTALRSSGGE